jgi:hypothetical protein
MASRGVMSDVAQRNCSTWNNCVGGYRCWWDLRRISVIHAAGQLHSFRGTGGDT